MRVRSEARVRAHLVGEDDEPVAAREADDALDVGAREHLAGRVARVDHDERARLHLGAVRPAHRRLQRALELAHREAPVARLVQVVVDLRAPSSN